MKCSKCGFELKENAKFCSGCGAKVEPDSGSSNAEGASAGFSNSSSARSEEASFEEVKKENSNVGNDGKINWKEYLTKENIERFAPLATLVPLAMSLVTGVLGGILFHTVGMVSVGYTICSVLFAVLKIIFVAVPIAATAGLVYVVINFKDKTNVNAWITPAATFLASLSCIGNAFGWGGFSFITGLVAFVLGLEFLARIVIDNQPMDSAINPGAAFATYKQYYDNYRAKYPTTTELERSGIVDPENSEFDGSGFELLGYMILTSIVCVVTCGLAAPWMICKIYRWRIGHTVINGKRLTFTGSGGSLLGHWILWEILTIITCGIYGIFVYVALKKWELSHTYIEGEPVVANANESLFDGSGWEFLGYSLLSGLLLAVTCGLSYPWVMAILQKWDTGHQVINKRRLAFSGSGMGFLGEFLIIAVLTFITCGIYSPWGVVRMNKYIIRNTDFVI